MRRQLAAVVVMMMMMNAAFNVAHAQCSCTWSTAQLRTGRFGLAATSVGNVALFGGSAGSALMCRGVGVREE